MDFKWIIFGIFFSLFYYFPFFISSILKWKYFGIKMEKLDEELKSLKEKKNNKHCKYCKHNEVDDGK